MSLGTVDGQAGAERLLAVGQWESGMCLQAVWDTSGAGLSDSPGSYESARDWWARCPADRKHIGDRNPPKGGLLRFSNGSADGHICYSLGGEPAASTDKPSAGRTGVSSITEIEHSWGGRVYEGWTDWLGGWDVVTAAGNPNGAGTRNKGEDDMPTYNDTQNAVMWPNGNGYYTSYEQNVFNALKFWIDNGHEQPGTEGTVQREIYAVINAVAARDVQAEVSATVAALKAALPSGQVGDVDVEQIIAGVIAGMPKSFTVTPAKS